MLTPGLPILLTRQGCFTLEVESKCPEQWRKSHITVIYKSGDPRLPHNYRPITVIPLLYKLFARLLFNRLDPILDRQQLPEQAGFRRKFSTDDHLFTLTLIQEKTDEWQLPLWTATLDFKKAFDTVSHTALWDTLAAQNLPPSYIALLTKLYQNQTATVHTDRSSRQFDIQRGTKQGDPLSSLLFNALSEQIFRRLQPAWERRGCGVRMQSGGRSLTNLRFADDVILFASSLRQISKMLGEVQQEARKTGLELHPDKTKILHNQRHRRIHQNPETVRINDSLIEVLPPKGSQKYLGRKLTFEQPHHTEIDSRIAAAWRKFHSLKSELTTRDHSLLGRLRLFHGTVTPTVLYGCSSWTLTTELRNRLRRTQRQMLRMILGSPRRLLGTQQPSNEPHRDNRNSNSDTDSTTTTTTTMTTTTTTTQTPTAEEPTLEPWEEWVRRCTHQAERHLARLGIQDWPTLQQQRKTQWAERVSNEKHKWTYSALQWDPQTTHRQAHRRRGRPRTRWSDDIQF